MVWSAQTIPINKIKNDAWPNIVNKKSETFAPRGPPKLFIFKEDVLLNFANEMREMLSVKNLKKFPEMPSKGNLDLAEVKKSVFFCI